MTERFQYPVWAANDPEQLSATLRDEIEWFSALSRPDRPRQSVATTPSFFIDGEQLADDPTPEAVTLDEHAPLSQPTSRIRVQQPEATVIDPTTLDAALRDELQWYQDLRAPIVLPRTVITDGVSYVEQVDVVDDQLDWLSQSPEPTRRLTRRQRAGEAPSDPATLGDPLSDKLEWWQDLNIPTLPRHLTRPDGQAAIDPETLNDPEDDRLQWFTELNRPTLPPHLVRIGGQSPIDLELLGLPAQDKLEWFQLLSEPTLRRVSAENMPEFSMDADTLGAEGVGTTFRRTFDLLGEKRGRDLLGKDTGVDLRGKKSGQDLTGEV